MNKVVTKGGEKLDSFPSGAVRGSDADKPIFEWRGLTYVPWSAHTDVSDKGKVVTRQSFIYNDVAFDVEHNEPINYALPWAETDTSMIPDLMLNRVGGLFWRGAQKYSRDNWKKGMNMARTFSSMFRHMIYWWAGDTSEDHLSAVIWNATVLMWTEAQVVNHVLPDNLADCGPMKGYKRDTGKV